MNKIKSGVKAGGVQTANHGLRVKAGVKAGGLRSQNHGLRAR